uniref:Ribosomal_S10 domain-containing protein n=1 Tax=Steinernema glaseri TaxID=37863 RepID=A0A1I8AQX3_9BILA
MNRSLTRTAQLLSSRQFATLREQARKVDPRYIYEPEFKDPRIYPTLPQLNVRLQAYDYVPLELFQAYVHKIAKRFSFDVVESYAVAAKTERCVTYKPNSTVVDSEVVLSTYDRVVRLENVYAVHLPLFVSLLHTHLPVGVKMTVKEHEKADDEIRYIPDILLKQKQEELKALDDPVVRRNLGWE